MWDTGQPGFPERGDQAPDLQPGGPALTASPADPSGGLSTRAPHPGGPGALSHPLLGSLVFPVKWESEEQVSWYLSESCLDPWLSSLSEYEL